MSEELLQVPPIRFPLVGNSGAVGLFSLLHIALAGLSVGFMVLAPVLEYLGIRDPFYTRLAKTLVQFVAIIFSVSATFAVIMLELFIGLFPVTTVYLFNRFEWTTYAAIGIFLLHIFFFYTYWYRWEKMRARSVTRHIVWGSIAAVLILIWGGLLDGFGSYMLTPPPAETASMAGAAGFSPSGSLPFNLTWLPLSLHRLVGSFIVAFYAIGLYGGGRLLQVERRKLIAPGPTLKRGGSDRPAETEPEGDKKPPGGPDRRDDLRVMTFGVLAGTGFLLIQPIAGMLYSHQIGRANPQAVDRILHGPNRSLLFLQFILVGLLFILANRFFSGLTFDKNGSKWFNVAVFCTALAMALTTHLIAVRRLLTLALVAITLCHLILILSRKAPIDELRPASWLAISLGFCAMLTYLTMGVIREQIRRPYTVYGQVHLLDEQRERPTGLAKR